MGRADWVLELALELGFDVAGLGPLAPPPDGARFEAWLAQGRHAGMDWLARERARILDPGRRTHGRPGAILSLAYGHHRAAGELAGGGRVARYALGRDYHNVVGRLQEKLARRLTRAGIAEPIQRVVDAGALLERSHAARAQVGQASKAGNLLDPLWGPWFFLAELVFEGEFEPRLAARRAQPSRAAAKSVFLPSGDTEAGTSTRPEGVVGNARAKLPAAAHALCGSCTACLDVCPTGAIVEPGAIDARACISYHTIEHRNAIPRELRASFGSWTFGCDLCSEVCPWGQRAPDASARFGLHPGLERARLVDWIGASSAPAFEALHGSPLRRAGRVGLARNAAIALGNAPSAEGESALRAALESEPEPVPRAAAGWALAHGYGRDAGVRAALERAAVREPDAAVQAELRADLSASAPA
jgi:epoxyqueuosine reductase